MRPLFFSAVAGILIVGLSNVSVAATPFDLGKMQETLMSLSGPTEIEAQESPLIDFTPIVGSRELQRFGVLQILEDFHHVKFKVGPDVGHRTITYTAKGLTLAEALHAVMQKCDCDYSIMPDGTIFVQANPKPEVPSKKKTDSK